MPAPPPSTMIPHSTRTDAWVEIIEQPSAKSTRFRYECEGRTAGSIVGKNSTSDLKTFPAIKVHNHSGACVVVVSLVTADEDKQPMPHPHALVGTDCRQEVCTKKVKAGLERIEFAGLGVQCKKKNQLETALTLRQQIRVDPFRTGFEHAKKENVNKIDLMAVRLCFQVFLPDASGKYQKALKPITSCVIYDKKAANELVINDFVPSTSPMKGREPMILLTAKLPKDGVDVIFYEGPREKPTWTAKAEYNQKDIHMGVAIKVKIPEYNNPRNVKDRPQVFIELRNRSKDEHSERRTFSYFGNECLNSSMPKPKKHRSDGSQSVSSKRIKRDPSEEIPAQENLPTLLSSYATSGSTDSSFRSSMSSGVTQYNEDMNNPQQQPQSMTRDSAQPIVGQDAWIPVRATDFTFFKTSDGMYQIAPGPTAANQRAPARDLNVDDWGMTCEDLEGIIQAQRENPDGEINIPSNIVSGTFSDLFSNLSAITAQMSEGNMNGSHEQMQSNSLTREIAHLQ